MKTYRTLQFEKREFAKRVEIEFIESTLAAASHCFALAARIAEMDRRNFRRLLNRYGYRRGLDKKFQIADSYK